MENEIKEIGDAVENVEGAIVEAAKDAEGAGETALVDAIGTVKGALTEVQNVVQGLGERVASLEGTVADHGFKIESLGSAPSEEAVHEVDEPEPQPNPAIKEKGILAKLHDAVG